MPKRLKEWTPKQDRETLRCKACKIDKPLTEFETHGVTKSGYIAYRARCKQCNRIHRKNWKRDMNVEDKQLFVSRVKQKCCICGYSRCKAALDFHHINDATKLFEICDGVFSRSITIEMLQMEIDKCIVLCCRCHREYHAGLIDKWVLGKPQAGEIPPGT